MSLGSIALQLAKSGILVKLLSTWMIEARLRTQPLCHHIRTGLIPKSRTVA